jgi:tripartite-type tricarboxylate transporter receptor subunit TctC
MKIEPASAMRRVPVGRAVLALALLALASGGARAAETPADFYRGKTLTFIIGAAAGAAYDLVGRAVAAHMRQHIPGEPAIVVQNMPGAASLVMVNHLYNRAPKDGTVFGLPLNGILLEPSLNLYSGNGASVNFDLGRMGFIGSPSQQPQVLWVWHTTPFRSFKDMQAGKATFGATSPAADNYILPLMLNRLLGAKIEIVTGYQAVNDIFLAAERGEIQGNTTPFSTITIGRPDDLAQGRIRVLAQFGNERLGKLATVPTGLELAGDEGTRRVLALYALKFRSAFPLMLPPGVPGERVAALQKAFDDTMQDRDFLATAARSGLDVSPTAGKDVEAIIHAIETADQGTVDALRKAIAR